MLNIRKLDMSDIHFLTEAESIVLGTKIDKKTIMNEALYNDMAHYFVALLDHKRVGYIGFWITEPNAELLNIFVHENYRNKNIGKSLIKAMIDYCENAAVASITLEVRPSNIPALNVYRAFNFKTVATRKNYYPNGEDALLMEKQLGVLQ
ncbi:MAG: ribosomal protein S18-alanine N-acetyltransferase [Bacillota bacterium]